jgi:hypothetical protein
VSSSDFYLFCLILIIDDVTAKQHNPFSLLKTSGKNKVYESRPVKCDSSAPRNSAFSNDRNKTHIRSLQLYFFPSIT